MTTIQLRRRNLARAVAIGCVAACAPWSGGRAQTAPELTLSQAIALALRQHPSLVLAEANVSQALSQARDAKASRLPSLALDGNVIRFEEPMVVAPLHRIDLRNLPIFDRTLAQASLTLGYTLFDAARGARIERAQAFAAAAQSGAAAAHQQVMADVARAYLRVQSAREVALAHAHRTAALEQERKRAAQLVEQGRAARVVLLRADAASSTARAEAVSASSDVEVSENELARHIGSTGASVGNARLPMVRAASVAVPTPAQVRESARAYNATLLRAQRQVAAAAASRGEARGLWWPRFQLGGRFIEYASPASHGQGEWQGGAQLSYPLFTGGARTAANDRASAEVRAAQAAYDLVARQIDDAIDRALAMLSGARARITALEAAVAQSEEVTRIDRLALDAGAGVQSDYLSAEADLFRARAGLTEARAMELAALIELARLSGELSEEWIARNVESSK